MVFPQHEYYLADRNCGTLMCHYQHRSHGNPYINIGQQDITAHVDFTSLACAGADNELEVLGFTHQAGFLTNCGITNLVTSQDAVEQYNYAQQIKKINFAFRDG